MNNYSGTKLNELLWQLNNRQFSGLPVCSACEPFGLQINTDYIAQHMRQQQERSMPVQYVIQPVVAVYGQQQPQMTQQTQYAYAVPSNDSQSAVPGYMGQTLPPQQMKTDNFQQQQQQQPVMAVAAVQQQQRTMEVSIPPGAMSGSVLTVVDPNGNQVRLTVPEGCQPGSVVTIQY